MDAYRSPTMAGWFEKFCAVTSAVRNARAEQGIPPKEKVSKVGEQRPPNNHNGEYHDYKYYFLQLPIIS